MLHLSALIMNKIYLNFYWTFIILFFCDNMWNKYFYNLNKYIFSFYSSMILFYKKREIYTELRIFIKCTEVNFFLFLLYNQCSLQWIRVFWNAKQVYRADYVKSEKQPVYRNINPLTADTIGFWLFVYFNRYICNEFQYSKQNNLHNYIQL